ncbi:MAG TPA: hypothetical protein VEU72_04320 [Nitrosopumilaceae archaeon]|nr:hypothetical protein [Nitrosopumilaceae archaeon]
MFKNHDNTSKAEIILNLQNILRPNKINSVLYSDSFLKAGFIAKLVNDLKLDVLYLDLDLLYSGYIVSGMIKTPQNLTLFQPTFEILNNTLAKILVDLSTKKSVVIIDSLNGLFNMLNKKKDIGKLVTSYVMLLASIAYSTGSYVVITSMVRFKKEEGWVLSSTGKRLIEAKNGEQILLEKNDQGIILNFLDKKEKSIIPADSIPL